MSKECANCGNERIMLCPFCEHDFSEHSRKRDAEIAALRKQLPEGMEHCTILFNECKHGHGWLTAKNWVQHGCPTCEIAALREENKQLRSAMAGTLAAKDKILAALREAVRVLGALCQYRQRCMDRLEDCESRATADELVRLINAVNANPIARAEVEGATDSKETT